MINRKGQQNFADKLFDENSRAEDTASAVGIDIQDQANLSRDQLEINQNMFITQKLGPKWLVDDQQVGVVNILDQMPPSQDAQIEFQNLDKGEKIMSKQFRAKSSNYVRRKLPNQVTDQS